MMSKRYMFPQNYGERKKARLDVSISDHNFPLSQNAGSKEADNWGDDNDDEILLLASQACEQAYSSDISSLPDYSMCMNPALTSTQVSQNPGPSTSNTFKKPTSSFSTITSTNLKDKCNRISSPLPGITNKIAPTNNIDNFANNNFSEKIYKSQDAEYIYKQLLQLQEDNAKLKSENGKLLEKCVTKEGEVSILRTQLKTCQVSVDSARLDKMKAQEKVQMEWTEKLTTANKEMQELRTQLDFKNLEIISMKERCRMLESSKVKLTQVTLAGGDTTNGHRLNSGEYESPSQRRRRPLLPTNSATVETTAVQTDARKLFVKLNKTRRSQSTKLKHHLPYMLQRSDHQLNILEHNEKLHKPPDFSQDKCRIYSTFHRIPNTPVARDKNVGRVCFTDLSGDVSCLVTAVENGDCDMLTSRFCKLVKSTINVLHETEKQLQSISSRLTPAFQKEMDERYIESTKNYCDVSVNDLLAGQSLFKEEQAILPRRLIAILGIVLEYSKQNSLVQIILGEHKTGEIDVSVIDMILRICELIDTTSCAVLYSGLLASIVFLLKSILIQKYTGSLEKIVQIIKCIVTSRPIPVVSSLLLSLLKNLVIAEPVLIKLCSRSSTGNLKVDYDQGVLLYKKDTCLLQVLLKQIECSIKCMEKQQLIIASSIVEDLIAISSYIDTATKYNYKCDCQLVLYQVLVYALHICAAMFKKLRNTSATTRLPQALISGLHQLYRASLRSDFSSRLAYYEGHHDGFLLICRDLVEELPKDVVIGNILSELLSSLQPSNEDIDLPSTSHKQVWLDTFSRFSITD